MYREEEEEEGVGMSYCGGLEGGWVGRYASWMAVVLPTKVADS